MAVETNPSPGSEHSLEAATLGGGCFWCIEAVFEQLRGVAKVESGYAGGSMPGPTYREVCSGATGHAEVIQVTFDPAAVSYREILEVFFAAHDPTTLNRQGPDAGTQYRSVVFYHTPQQKQVAEDLIAELNMAGVWEAKIVTEVAPLTAFYAAEEYHQGYYRLNREQRYCQVMIAPKLAKFRKQFAAKIKA